MLHMAGLSENAATAVFGVVAHAMSCGQSSLATAHLDKFAVQRNACFDIHNGRPFVMDKIC